MPDVRRACAAPVLGTGSTSLPPHIREAGSSSPRMLSLASGSPRRRPFAPHAHPGMVLRSPHGVARRLRLTIGTADGAFPTIHGSSRAFALPVLRLIVPRRSESTFGKPPATDESRAMPSFTGPTASGSIPAHQSTGEAALALSRVLRRPRSSSTRPEERGTGPGRLRRYFDEPRDRGRGRARLSSVAGGYQTLSGEER